MAKLKQTTAPAPVAPTASTAIGETWNPAYGEQQSAALPRLPARPPALKMFHPERWTVISGHVVPLLGDLKLQPGINRIRMTREGRFLKLEAQAAAEEQGWTIIPHDVDGESYIRQVAPAVFVTRWERVFPNSAHVECDESGYALWLRGLIDRGVIPRPAGYVLEMLRSKRQKEHDDVSDKVATVPSLRSTVERLAADLRAIDAEIDRYGRGAGTSGTAVELDQLLGE